MRRATKIMNIYGQRAIPPIDIIKPVVTIHAKYVECARTNRFKQSRTGQRVHGQIPVSNTFKENLTEDYNHYVTIKELTWVKPVYKRNETPIQVPTKQT